MESPYKYKDRYPGLNPFAKDQSAIFFGREMEKTDLFYQTSLEKMVVLFGNSGLGKSSLMNAGVSPMLESNGYLPIRVRLNPYVSMTGKGEGENLLLRDFKLSFDFFKWKDRIIYNKDNPLLWEYIKATPFRELITEEQNPVLYKLLLTQNNERNVQQAETSDKRDQKTDITPVFIFDQFEEFFNHPSKHQHEFLKQLAEVVHDETPYRILEWITSVDPEERTEEQVQWHHQPKVKFVFALRSDRLALMQSITTFIPTILRNRYELKPLTENQAKTAIEEPGKILLPDDFTPPFLYDQTTINKIVAELSQGTNEIESSQLQIVCNAIEKKIKRIAKEFPAGEAITVNGELINPERDIPKIFENFYETQLELIPDEQDRQKIRLLIEDHMVVGNSRDSISENKLKLFNIDKRLIKEMMDTRLVRWENTSRGPVYELTHDSLLETVIKSKEKRIKNEQKAEQEKEKLLAVEEAKKKDKELREKHSQLAMEMKLRKEAEELTTKLESRKRLIFFLGILLLAVSIALLSITGLTLKNARGELRDTRKLVTSETRKVVDETLRDSALIKGTPLKQDSAKVELVKAIDRIDSISEITGQKDERIYKVLDSVFTKEVKLQEGNWENLDSKEKIKAVKEYYRTTKGFQFEGGNRSIKQENLRLKQEVSK
jgi:hypothetical protein